MAGNGINLKLHVQPAITAPVAAGACLTFLKQYSVVSSRAFSAGPRSGIRSYAAAKPPLGAPALVPALAPALP